MFENSFELYQLVEFVNFGDQACNFHDSNEVLFLVKVNLF